MSKLLALGDSHLEALKLAAELNLLEVRSTHFCIIPGATAVGLRNPNSATNAIEEFRNALNNAPDATHILIHLGEVDCGFVTWWRAQKYGDSIETQTRQSLAAYKAFLKEIGPRGTVEICITGASLPTIRDGVDFGEVANKRAEVRASLLERTALTKRYNEELKKIAQELQCDYFDISNAVTNSISGLVSDFFRNPIEHDHHLDPAKTVGVWARACNEFLSNKSIPGRPQQTPGEFT